MFKIIEKWALKRLLKRISKDIGNPQIWEDSYDDIEKKVAAAIKNVLLNLVNKNIGKVKEKLEQYSEN